MGTDLALEFDSLLDVSRRIARRDISSVEVTHALLGRIERVGPTLHAFSLVCADTALAAAEKADREIAGGFRRGPLHGVPIALKDLIFTRDHVTASGMPIFADWRPDRDATVVTRLRRSGAVIIAKAQMTEGATIAHHPDIAAPINPWRADRCSGFSSSGSGVSVAAGLCYAALGSDTGGSIRIPAAMNGTTGIKPTWGRVSRHGVFPLVEAYDTVGPLARDAADVAAVLGAIGGADLDDPTASPHPLPDYLATIDRGVDGVTIGLDLTAIEECSDAQVTAVIRAAAAVFADLGAAIRTVTIPTLDMIPMLPVMTAGMIAGHRATYPAQAERYGPALRAMLDQAAVTSGSDVTDALDRIDRLRGELDLLFAKIDLLLVPVLTGPTPEAGAVERHVLEDPEALFGLVRFTGPFNVSRQPSIALRGGTDSAGMPIGFQLVGRWFDEELLLRAAHSYQRATNWHRLRPPID